MVLDGQIGTNQVFMGRLVGIERSNYICNV